MSALPSQISPNPCVTVHIYLHADYCYPKVCSTQIHCQRALGFQDVVNVLGDVFLDRREAEFLLKGFSEVNRLEEL